MSEQHEVTVYDRVPATARVSVGQIDRFWSCVAKAGDDECWLWARGRFKAGYGNFYDGEKQVYAHRYSWELKSGEAVPQGMCVMHSCDNPPCVNPRHLSIGTTRDNAVDMVSKGRHRRVGLPGEKHGRSKLSDQDAVDIRRARGSGVPVADLARRYGISRSNVGMVARGHGWHHLDQQVPPVVEKDITIRGRSILRTFVALESTRECVRLRDMASVLGLDRSAVSLAVATLRRNGYIDRNAGTGAGARFTLTEKARRWIDEHWASGSSAVLADIANEEG